MPSQHERRRWILTLIWSLRRATSWLTKRTTQRSASAHFDVSLCFGAPHCELHIDCEAVYVSGAGYIEREIVTTLARAMVKGELQAEVTRLLPHVTVCVYL